MLTGSRDPPPVWIAAVTAGSIAMPIACASVNGAAAQMDSPSLQDRRQAVTPFQPVPERRLLPRPEPAHHDDGDMCGAVDGAPGVL